MKICSFTFSVSLAIVLVMTNINMAVTETHIPTTLDGPFDPVTRRFDSSLRRGSDDLPMTHPRLRKNVTSNFPEQIALAISSPTSMWVSWVTGDAQIGLNVTPLDPASVGSEVWYGKKSGKYTSVGKGASLVYSQLYPFEGLWNYTSGIIHHVKLEGLEPGTRYYYKCGDSSIPAVSQEHFFETFPKRSPNSYPGRIAVIGDLGLTSNSTTTIDHLIYNDASMILMIGDLTYANQYLTTGGKGVPCFSCAFPVAPIRETYQPRCNNSNHSLHSPMPPTKSPSSRRPTIPTGLVVGIAVGAFSILCIFCRKKKKRRPDSQFYDPPPQGPEETNTDVQRSERNLIPVTGSSSSAVSPPTKHDVFLSFRGEDTRHSFTSHLYAALRAHNIETYMDDRLVRGQEISPALETAIEESMIYVIIFSKDYASSTWCLDELTKILDCKKRYERAVIPIFYKVDPSNVRHHKESYAESFLKHEKRFKNNMNRVHAWKAALTEAAGFVGLDSQVIRPESKLVGEIVKDILRRLNSSSISDHEGLIGIHQHIERIQSMLHVESEAVRIIGIWGKGGIGKTTIAGAIYHKLATQFSSKSFVENVQENVERDGGIHRIKEKYLSELLEEEGRGYSGLSLKQRLKRTKVLLILDNVNNPGQLKDLIGGHGSFGQGSRVILTSRDKQVLNNVKPDEIYEVNVMNFQDSLQLFSLNAFKQNYPIETYMGLSEEVLNYAKGIPLALKVLGSLLYGRPREEWESELKKLKKLPDLEIFDVLKLSYDGLDDDQKEIFLDIACFYRGHERSTVTQTLDSCGFSAAIGIGVLIDRCLISDCKRKIVMHDLIQNMGHEIVRRQGVNDPGKRTRLWKHEDIYHVLKYNKGTDEIQCILLDICKIREVELHAETFRRMHNLRMLQFHRTNLRAHSKVSIPALLDNLPDELRFLRWDSFPQRSLPLDFCPENLVELNMPDSLLEQLWDRDQHLPNLKRLDLGGSHNLIQIPDLSQLPNIEEIILSHCMKLVVVYSSCFLSKLNCLLLNGCVELRSLNLPSHILSRSSGLIYLSNCHNLEMFSVSNITVGVLFHGCSRGQWDRRGKYKKEGKKVERPGRGYFPDTFDPIDSPDICEEQMDKIQLLNLKVLREGSPSLFPSLNELCWVDLSYCESLTILPIDFYKLRFLRRLYLRGCSNLEKFPEIKEPMENLMVLILDQTAIQELPSSLHHLVGLEELSLHRCQRLEFIPSSIGNLSRLCRLDLTYCESLETLPISIFKLKLTKLDLHGCLMLRTLPEILEPAESFAQLRLTKTAIKEIPSSLDYFVGLQTLHLNLCSDLEFLPNSIINLNLLSKLDCSGCGNLTEIPNDIGRLSSLRDFSLQGSPIVNLPESIACLSSLKSLDLSDCKELESVPNLPPFLKQLLAFDCPSIRRMSSSMFKLPSDSKEGIFKFHLTNCEELDPGNIVADACSKILQEAYRSVFFCFPGSTVPNWFPHRCEGHSVTLDRGFLNRCNDGRFIGFALCVVLGVEGRGDESRYSTCSYRFAFESDYGTHFIPNPDKLRCHFFWKGRDRYIVHDHTFMWKYLLDSTGINYMLSHAHNFTFEISEIIGHSYYEPTFTVKECGLRPLYTKEKHDNTSGKDYWVHYTDQTERPLNYGHGYASAQSL